jgi:beta-lactamase
MSNHAVQAKSYSNKQLRQYTLKMMKKHHLRGSIEIVKNGHAQRVSLGYGYYSKRLKNGNTKLLYPVGSLQKMVTAAIITQLIYQKKFNQNTKISRWYPNLKHANQITVGQ